jgi:hypothetical protein
MAIGQERPLSAVPAWVWALLAAALAAQIAWQAARAPGKVAASAALPPAPSAAALELAAFGERPLLARLVMVYLQSFDLRGLDYRRLVAWLDATLALDPRSEYPLFAAARVYAEVPDAARARLALEFVHRHFLEDPDRRWPWLAHAALLAKHRLGDLPLALRYARAVERQTRSPDVPLWARQMQIFILEDMNELEAATIMLGGLLESGQVDDPAEARFLAQRLKELEARRAGARNVK